MFFRDGEYSWVHSLLLKRRPKLEERIYANLDEVWPGHLDLKEFDHDTGHTIIHYLYSGNYQRLRANKWKTGEANKQDLAEGLRVCIAAESPMLFSLRLQAEQEIETVGDKLSLPVIFGVIEESKIALDQVPKFRDYLQRRMNGARFGAPAQSLKQVLLDLHSANTLSALTLKTMVLKHRRGAFVDNKTNIAKPNQRLEKPNVQQTLQGSEEPTALQLLERQIKKRQEGGKKLKAKEQKRLTTLESAASILRNAEPETSSEKVKGFFDKESSVEQIKKKVHDQAERSEETEDESTSTRAGKSVVFSMEKLAKLW